MKEVELNISELDDNKTDIFSTCLHNIETLKLRKMTAEGTQRVSAAIILANKPVR